MKSKKHIYHRSKAFTLIELSVVIALISILAVTLAVNIRSVINKSKVSRVLHYLNMIQSKLSYSAVHSGEYPDLEDYDSDLLYKFNVYPTEDFSYDGTYHEETNKIVEARNNTGGWLYNKNTGEVYANLPNGAYTGKDAEIWNGESGLWFTLEDLQNLEDVGDVVAMKVDENGKYINNGDFEDFDGNVNTWNLFGTGKLPSWETTASDGKIEIWKDGFQGVPAENGDYFMELNATQSASLFQDIVVIPGSTIEWSINHRGRQGEDKATVSIGSGDTLEVAQTMVTGKEWVTYSGTYIVPEGQTVMRFSVDSISTAGGNKSVGNLIDNISIGVKLD